MWSFCVLNKVITLQQNTHKVVHDVKYVSLCKIDKFIFPPKDLKKEWFISSILIVFFIYI